MGIAVKKIEKKEGDSEGRQGLPEALKHAVKPAESSQPAEQTSVPAEPPEKIAIEGLRMRPTKENLAITKELLGEGSTVTKITFGLAKAGIARKGDALYLNPAQSAWLFSATSGIPFFFPDVHTIATELSAQRIHDLLAYVPCRAAYITMRAIHPNKSKLYLAEFEEMLKKDRPKARQFLEDLSESVLDEQQYDLRNPLTVAEAREFSKLVKEALWEAPATGLEKLVSGLRLLDEKVQERKRKQEQES